MSDTVDNPSTDSEVQLLKKSIFRWLKITAYVLCTLITVSGTVMGYYHNRVEKNTVSIIEVKKDAAVQAAVQETRHEAVITKQNQMHDDIRDIGQYLLTK